MKKRQQILYFHYQSKYKKYCLFRFDPNTMKPLERKITTDVKFSKDAQVVQLDNYLLIFRSPCADVVITAKIDVSDPNNLKESYK